MPDIRSIPIYPGGPTLHVPPAWTDDQVAAALAKLRAPHGIDTPPKPETENG